MKIPVADPGASYRRLAPEIDKAVLSVLRSGWYILGEVCKQFEQAYASFCGAPHCIGVANGTDAVELALRACGVGYGDRVLTVANTAVATVAAIERIGAIPVFADVDEGTQTLSPVSFSSVIKKERVKAAVIVHLFGQPAEMEKLLQIADGGGVPIIEDCAQAHGARIGSKKVGTFGRAGAFSFYPTKNLGAFGDGGAIITSQDDMAEQLKLLRQYGWRERYQSEITGFNSRLDEIQAAILMVKLSHLETDNVRRHELALRYLHLLQGLPLRLPCERAGSTSVYHQFVVQTERRDALSEHLLKKGIGTAVLYPTPIHRQPAYRGRYRDVSLPVTEQLANSILCLPIYPELTDEKIEFICESVREFFESVG